MIRDLITDVSADYRKAHTISSFTQTGDPAPSDYRMTQVDIGRSQEFRTCIECWLCQDVCHLIRDHKDNPRPQGQQAHLLRATFFIRHAGLDMHPLGTLDRDLIREQGGLGLRNVIKITDNAIIP